MNAFHPRRVHEDLEQWPRRGQLGDELRVEFEGEVELALAVRVGLEVVRSQRGFDEADVEAKDAIFIRIRDALERVLDLRTDSEPRALSSHADIAQRGVEVIAEELDQRAGDGRMLGQRLLDVGLAQQDADLAHVLRVGAKHDDLVPLQLRAEDEAIEPVALRFVSPDAGERVLELLLQRSEVFLHPLAVEAEVADAHREGRAQRLHFIRHLGQHLESHVLEARHDLGERDRRTGVNDLAVELQLVLARSRAMTEDVDDERAGRQHALDVRDVVQRGVGGEALLIGHRERFHVAVMQVDPDFFAARVHERVEQAIAPRPRRVADDRFDAANVDVGDLPRRAHDEETARERGGCADVIVDDGIASAERLFEHLARAIFELGRVTVARHEDVAGDEALEDVLAREERHALAFLQMQDSARDLEEIVVGDLEELVAREGLEDVDERLAVVRVRIEARALDGPLRLQAQHRDVAARCGYRRPR